MIYIYIYNSLLKSVNSFNTNISFKWISTFCFHIPVQSCACRDRLHLEERNVQTNPLFLFVYECDRSIKDNIIVSNIQHTHTYIIWNVIWPVFFFITNHIIIWPQKKQYLSYTNIGNADSIVLECQCTWSFI